MARFEDSDYFDDFDDDADEELVVNDVLLPQHRHQSDSLPGGTFSNPIQTVTEETWSNEIQYPPTVTGDTITFTSDPLLSDSCREHQFSMIQQAWHVNGMIRKIDRKINSF